MRILAGALPAALESIVQPTCTPLDNAQVLHNMRRRTPSFCEFQSIVGECAKLADTCSESIQTGAIERTTYETFDDVSRAGDYIGIVLLCLCVNLSRVNGIGQIEVMYTYW